MPLQKCKDDKGRSGYRWGSKGKCYGGPDGKRKALKQGYAIDPEKFKKEMAALGASEEEIQSAIADYDSSLKSDIHKYLE